MFTANGNVTIVTARRSWRPHQSTAVTQYDGQGNPTWSADGVGSELALPNLTLMKNAGTTGGGGYPHRIQALNGGRVDLHSVTAIVNGYLPILADGNNSRIDFSSMTSLTATSSSLEARNGGEVVASQLTRLTGVNLILNASGTIPTAQITSLTYGGVTTTRAADFAALTSVVEQACRRTLAAASVCRR